eukprot:1247211-Pleurochrysis_carterae.AAC.1
MLSPTKAFDDAAPAPSTSPQGPEESSAAPRPDTLRCNLVTDTDDECVAPERRLLNEMFGTSNDESAESPTVAATAPA